MVDVLRQFEKIARSVASLSLVREDFVPIEHPFEQRNISNSLPPVVRKLFDDGHYAQSTFEGFKFVDKVTCPRSLIHS
jgi:hypothetical protein